MQWKAFERDGMIYNLAHLHPRRFRFERPAVNGKPGEAYTVDVLFTSHCFTHEPKTTEAYDRTHIYPDHYENRLFDLGRYEMSKRLPEFIQALPTRKPRHNGSRGNYFSVEIFTENGATIEYDIFFKVKKTARGRLEMIVETAFIRDPAYHSVRPNGKPISFWIILHHTLNQIKIRT